MERRAPGHTKLFAAMLLCGIVFFGCLTREETVQTKNYIDAAQADIRTKRGVTYLGRLPLTGIVYSLGAGGDTTMTVPYVNGKESGIARAWYDSGKLKELRLFVDGKKSGTHYGWYESGARRFEYSYHNDEFDGAYNEWLPDGKPLLALHFKDGHESGLQQTWFENGTIKSNYLIKNGRRYGLLGTNTCVTVSDSIPR